MLARACDIELGEVASILIQHEILKLIRSLNISARQKECQALDAEQEIKSGRLATAFAAFGVRFLFPFGRVCKRIDA
jgi:hypothetical protein